MEKEPVTYDLTGRKAVVTGASEGIGKAIACALAANGAEVILCSRRAEALQSVMADITSSGGQAQIFALDVTNLDSLRRLKEFVADRFGRLDILVNNAAYTVTKPAVEVTEAEWDAMVNTSLKGLFFCSQILSALMRPQQYGKVINISSTLSRRTGRNRAVYAAIKAATSHLTSALASEWGPEGIRVNAIAPAAVMTPTRESVLTGQTLSHILQHIPLGRLATPEDIANAAVFLSSSASDFITGDTLLVDGGYVSYD